MDKLKELMDNNYFIEINYTMVGIGECNGKFHVKSVLVDEYINKEFHSSSELESLINEYYELFRKRGSSSSSPEVE